MRLFDSVENLNGSARTGFLVGTGQYPQWNRTGTELFYIGDDGRELMSVPIKLAPKLEIGVPRKLFDAPTRGGLGIGSTSWHPTVSRFVVIEPASAMAPGTEPLSVVLNWSAALKNRQ